jgi:endoglycosylceramidase
MRRAALAALLFLALAACGGSLPGTDAGADASADVTTPMDGGDGATARYVMPACQRPAGPFAPLSTRCQHFVDAQGRVVLLHGINARVRGVFDVTFDDGRAPLEDIPEFTLDDARRMRAMGFNLLRLPVNWSGVEPTETGGFSAQYLDAVAAAVDLARQAGLYVLIDFHQDAYSKEIGEDGAPLWAIQPPPEMLLGGPLTDLGARRASRQVLDAFATFFGDAEPGPRLRTRFARMAAHVARRFRDSDAVIGYELYNEPVTGQDELLRLHLEVARAIRAVDTRHLIVFEPPAARNLLDRVPLALRTFEAEGVAGGVYAPHVYTLAFTANETLRRAFTRDTLRVSNANAVREAAAWGTPLLITEFGYDPRGTRAQEYLELQGDIQDEFGASAAFWVWKENSQGAWGLFDYDMTTGRWTERAAVRRAVTRVMPEAIAGWPEGWRYDRATRRFELRYQGSDAVSAPTRIFVPAPEDFAASFEVTCDGAVVRAGRSPTTGVVQVPCTGPGLHVVTVTAR